MEDEKVKVVLEVPKKLQNFIERIAALEGSTPQDWYLYLLKREWDAIAADDFAALVDPEKMKALYQ